MLARLHVREKITTFAPRFMGSCELPSPIRTKKMINMVNPTQNRIDIGKLQVVRSYDVQLDGEKADTKRLQSVRENLNQDSSVFPAVFAMVPWGHHINIISKCKSIDEALFYVKHTIDRGWSRNTLMNCIKADLYHTEDKAITNFSAQLPVPQVELAQAITKDTYDFGFLSEPTQLLCQIVR